MKFSALEKPVKLDFALDDIVWGDRTRWNLFGGPDIIEDEGMVLEVAQELKKICAEKNVGYVLKCSFDKANRQSITSYRGPGVMAGLEALGRIKSKVGVPLITDVHETSQMSAVAEVADVIQIPAFLCRQTDLVVEAAKTGRVLHVKKGQFMAPEDMQAIAQKAVQSGNEKVLLCDRGTTFGYQRLINDMTGLAIMREFGFPVVIDMTHSTQRPGAAGGKSGGNRELAPIIARAAMGVGVDGVFCETHPNPEEALCDAATSFRLSEMAHMIDQLNAVWQSHESY